MPLNERPLRPPFSGAAPARGLNFLHQWLCHNAPQTAKSEMIIPVDELTPRVDGRVDGRPGSYEAPNRGVETPSPCIQGNREKPNAVTQPDMAQAQRGSGRCA
ncbi:DUF768 domain-containing protein [Mesorhizobium sp. B2-4-15]|nr:DUF768 domain-containing protein [Mesorhizobium sp. B2-4-15]